MSKYNPHNTTPGTLKLDNCVCKDCEHYYSVYEAHTVITNKSGEKNVILKHLCFCGVNLIGLPFFQDVEGKLCPDVVSCETYSKEKNTEIKKI